MKPKDLLKHLEKGDRTMEMIKRGDSLSIDGPSTGDLLNQVFREYYTQPYQYSQAYQSMAAMQNQFANVSSGLSLSDMMNTSPVQPRPGAVVQTDNPFTREFYR